MDLCVKRSAVFLYASILIFSLGGCQKKVTFPNCKKDADCRIDAAGKAVSGVCHMGKCEECIKDVDCVGLKQCVDFRCVSACVTDADCAENQHCEAGLCVIDCMSDASCPENNVCVQGRCVEEFSEIEGDEDDAFALGECQELARIHFDFDRYEVKPEYFEQVASLAKCLERNLDYTVLIEGHTDDRGTPSYNMALGQKRADSVRNYLKTNWGIASNRIRTLSYGEQRPAIRERTTYAWQQNRRTEFTLEKN